MTDRAIPQNTALRKNARDLRKNMTKQERRLWYEFLSQYDIKWRRQQIIENYIADFYAAAARLVVELDGSQHFEPQNMKYDEKRTERIEKYNIEVLRFSNLEVDKCFREVCETIDYRVELRLRELG